MRRTPVARRHAPLPGQSADDTALASMSELGSDELNQLNPDAGKHPKPARSTSTDAAQEVLVRDSDAVASVFYPEQRWLGALLSTADGGSSVLCYLVQAVCVGNGVFLLLTYAQSLAAVASMPEPNALLYVTAGLCFGWAALALVVGSARDALRSGGALEQLKVGQVMISEKDGATLSRWRVGLGAVGAFWVLLGLLLIAAGIFELPPFGVPNSPAVARINNVLSGLLFGTVLPLAFSGWLHSMYTASCLCRDEVVEVIHKVRTVDPTLEEWDESVAEPALGLIDKMKLLSDGWSGGLAGFGGFFWLAALCWFTIAINVPFCEGFDAAKGSPPGTQRTICLVLTAIGTALPFMLALDIAATSTWCDTLMAELNDARANHGPGSHLKIQWLETTLRQLVRLRLSQPHSHAHSHSHTRVLPERRPRAGLQSPGTRGDRQKIHGALRSQALHYSRHHRHNLARI